MPTTSQETAKMDYSTKSLVNLEIITILYEAKYGALHGQRPINSTPKNKLLSQVTTSLSTVNESSNESPNIFRT